MNHTFWKTMTAAATMCAAMALVPQAQAATTDYLGVFSGSTVKEGRFLGTDLNNDGKITTEELTSYYSLSFMGSPGGPSVAWFESTSVTDFLYEWIAGVGHSVSGTAHGTYRVTYCDGFDQMPCMMMDQIYGPNWGPKYEMRPISSAFSSTFADITIAPVPLPGALPLAAAGLGALAVLRRRRSVAKA